MTEDAEYIQLLAEAQSDSQAAMGRLAVLVRDRMYPFVFRTTLNRDVTEDVLQETLLAMICGLKALREPTRFWAWMYRIAWSKIQDRLRRRRLQSTAQVSLLESQRRAGRSPDNMDTPLDAKIRAETLAKVAVAVEQLDHPQRDIVHLRTYEQLPFTQIASRLRTTPQSVRARFHRAKKSLKGQLAACCL